MKITRSGRLTNFLVRKKFKNQLVQFPTRVSIQPSGLFRDPKIKVFNPSKPYQKTKNLPKSIKSKFLDISLENKKSKKIKKNLVSSPIIWFQKFPPALALMVKPCG